MEVVLAVLGGFCLAALVFYCAGQKIRIHILEEVNKTQAAALNRAAVAMFTEEQIKALADYLWKFPTAPGKYQN